MMIRWSKCAPALFLLCFLLGFLPVRSQAQDASVQASDIRVKAQATSQIPFRPSRFTDAYGVGRSLRFGLGFFITPVVDIQAEVEYGVHPYSPNGSLSQLPLRRRAPLTGGSTLPSSLDAYSGGTLTQTAFGFGLKYTISEAQSFNTYLRGLTSFTLFNRTSLQTAQVSVPAETFYCSGFQVDLGFEIPLGLTTHLIIEPGYSVSYPLSDPSDTLQAIDVSVGFLVNGN